VEMMTTTEQPKKRQKKEQRYITTPKFDELIKKIMKGQSQMDDFK